MLGCRQWNLSGCGMTEALSAPLCFDLALVLLPFAKRKASSTWPLGQGGWETVEHTWMWSTASERAPPANPLTNSRNKYVLYTCACVAEPLRCPPETLTALLICCTPIQNKKFNSFEKKKNAFWTGAVLSHRVAHWCFALGMFCYTTVTGQATAGSYKEEQ